MEKAVYVLQDALVAQSWESVDCLINYVLSESKEILGAAEISELIQLASIQLKMNVPLRDFLKRKNAWE